jgi:D-serine deaminase-like pyridoxal phosphate-dependent protein
MITPLEHVDWRTKGLWWPGPPVTLEEFAAARHDLFGGAFTWPVMVAERAALEHNIAALARFCARHGLEFAPHGKTTMAPSLFAAQLAAGATAVSVATAGQALACRAFGVPSVMLANELLDPGPLRWAAEQVEQGWEFLCFADSVAGVRAMSAAVACVPGRRPLRVLAELGHPGGRAGCRTVAELGEVARAAVEAPRIELAGVAAYEGGLPDAAAAGRYLDGVRAAVTRLSAERLLGEEVVVTAGGSKYFDVVADRLGGAWLPGRRLRVVLRSGAYISHDDGIYQDWTPFRRIPEEGSLEPALRLWAQVISTPEDGLAIVGMGKREAAYDEGLPMPQRVRALDGALRPAAGLRVRAVNDHHAYVEVDAGARVEPGELIRFGLSHPCTSFDKWQVIPVVDEHNTVVDLIRTYF